MRKFFIDYSNRINKLSILLYLSSFFLLIYFFNIQVIQNEEAKKIVKQKGWKAKTVYLAGFDGYQKGDRRLKIIEEIFNSYKETPGARPITAITPSLYNIKKKSIYTL